jgi:hypothetical protein
VLPPAAGEVAVNEADPGAAGPVEAAPPVEAVEAGASAPASTATVPADRVRVRAGRVRYEGAIAVIEGAEGSPVVVESGGGQLGRSRIQAQSVRIDLATQTLTAAGNVRVERQRLVSRRSYAYERSGRLDATGEPIDLNRGAFDPPDTSVRGAPVPTGEGVDSGGRWRRGRREEVFTEVLEGRDLTIDGRTRTGSLDGVQLQLPVFDLSAARLLIEPSQYVAQGVVLRPGGLSEAEKKIYGTPPLSLRAKEIRVLFDRVGTEGGTRSGRLAARNAALYFKNTRLVPVPGAILNPLVTLGPSRGPQKFRVVPDVGLNSSDRFLITTRLSFLLGASANAAAVGAASAAPSAGASSFSTLNLDLGLSARLGFRGGASLENRSPLGLFALQARRADVITTQLTNRLAVDRTPELSFDSALFPVLRLGGGRGVGGFASASAGRFSERVIGSSAVAGRTRSNRYTATVGLTTRVDDRDGVYADVFATRSRYSLNSARYNNTGFEVGYLGRLLPRVRGLISLRQVSIGGATPFLFDTVEIPKELRATFDIEASPRYLIPIDLRYDLDSDRLRDKSIGVLRNYKTFAYGLIYQTARRDLRLELRAGF